MFILAKSFINKKGEMFLKIFPRQYPSIETAHAAMQSDYQEELKKRHLDRSDEEANAVNYLTKLLNGGLMGERGSKPLRIAIEACELQIPKQPISKS